MKIDRVLVATIACPIFALFVGAACSSHKLFVACRSIHPARQKPNITPGTSVFGITSTQCFSASWPDSLRGSKAGLATQASHLYYLGIEPVRRSTLAYANEHRNHAISEKLFFSMLSKCQDMAPKHKFRFQNPLYSRDATTIDLCLPLYNWAKFRTTKGAVKLHVKYNHAGYLLNFAIMTTGKVHEQTVAKVVPFEKGDAVAFDCGYTDFSGYATLDAKGVYFVTRAKHSAAIRLADYQGGTIANV